MRDFLDRLLGRSSYPPKSKEIAKERLQLVLVSDRTNITPALLDILKNEIIKGISRHVEIDQAGLRVTVTQESSHTRVVADIPVERTREARAPRKRAPRREAKPGPAIVEGE